MTRILTAVLVAALFAVPTAPARADGGAQVSATVDRNRVEVGQVVRLDVAVTVPDEHGIEGLQLPRHPGFAEVGRSRSTQMSFSFGSGGQSMQRTVTHTLMLRALKTGVLTLAPAQLTYRGKRYTTRPITVTVLHAGALGGQQAQRSRQQNPLGAFGQNPFDPFGMLGGGQPRHAPVGDDDVFVRADVDRKTAWLGQQVTLRIEVYSRIDVTDFPGFKMPKLDGFWTEDLDSPTRITPTTRVLDGVPYRVYLLRRQAIFPLKSGTVQIDPVEVQVSTGFGLFSSGRTVTRHSKAVSLEVKPLPATGQPPGFQSTNIGSWRLQAKVDAHQVTLGQPVTLDLTATGQGNLDALQLPVLAKLPGLKTYDPTRTQEKRVQGARFGGEKKVEWVLVPTRTGDFEIPAFHLAYFNPETGAYETATTDPIRFTVTTAAGTQASAGAASGVAPASGPSNVLDGGGLREIRYAAALHRVRPALYRTRLFVALVALPVILLLAVVGGGRLRDVLAATATRSVGRRAPGVARARLKEARKLRSRGDLAGSFVSVEKALLDYLATRIGVAARGMSRDALDRQLRQRGFGPLRVERLCRVLEDCESARFSPVSPTDDEVEKLLDRAARVLADLDEGPGAPEGRAA